MPFEVRDINTTFTREKLFTIMKIKKTKNCEEKMRDLEIIGKDKFLLFKIHLQRTHIYRVFIITI